MINKNQAIIHLCDHRVCVYDVWKNCPLSYNRDGTPIPVAIVGRARQIWEISTKIHLTFYLCY